MSCWQPLRSSEVRLSDRRKPSCRPSNDVPNGKDMDPAKGKTGKDRDPKKGKIGILRERWDGLMANT